MDIRDLRWCLFVGRLAAGFTAFGCATPEVHEEQRMTTSKLLKAHAAASLPASETKEFVDAIGGVPIDVGAWEGYVAGTTPDALFAMHLSGTKDGKPVAGVTLAFAEGGSGAG